MVDFSSSVLMNEVMLPPLLFLTNQDDSLIDRVQQPTYDLWAQSHQNLLSCPSSASAPPRLPNPLYRIRKKKGLEPEWMPTFLLTPCQQSPLNFPY